MGLKAVLEGPVPEALKEFYVEKDGRFMLSVEGMVPEEEHLRTKVKLNEFRDNNVVLLKKIDQELQPKLHQFEGVDPEEYRTLKAKEAALKQKGVDTPDDVSAQIAKAMKPLQDKLLEQEKERAKLIEEGVMRDFDKDLTQIAIKAGNNPVFMPDIIERARKVFKYIDGKVVAKDGDGVAYDDKGNPLSIESWTPSLPREFLLPSSGGGALPGGVGAHAQKSDGKIRNASGTELKMDGITTL